MNQPKQDSNGYRGLQENIRQLKIEPKLEVIENQYSDRDYLVKLNSKEFTTVCPKTGLPDFANLNISYIPDKYLVEEKSLKLYLNAYRNLGIFQEHATNKVLDDFVAAVQPRYAKIVAFWNSRGGIRVVVEVEWKKISPPNLS